MTDDSSVNRSVQTEHAGAPQRVFLIGAMKAGTTSLFNYLAAHPEIYPCASKEPKYFREPAPSAEQTRAYQAMFSGRTNEKCVLEGSTCNTMYPIFRGVPQRIAAMYPQARFIYIVRDPIDRIWSQYVYYLWRDREHLPFAEAVLTKEKYVKYSQYYLQISQFLAVFPRERLLVLLFEDFLRDKLQILQRIWEFLGVDAGFRPENLNQVYNNSQGRTVASPILRMMRILPGYDFLPWRIRNRIRLRLGSTPPRKADALTPEIRRQLLELLRNDVHAFQSFMGHTIDIWPTVRSLNGDPSAPHQPVVKNASPSWNGPE